jgi:hypothetical protein
MNQHNQRLTQKFAATTLNRLTEDDIITMYKKTKI